MSTVSKQRYNPEEWLNGLVNNITRKTPSFPSKFQERDKPEPKTKKIESFQKRYEHFKTKSQTNTGNNQDKTRERTHSIFREVYQKIRKDIKTITGKNINISESTLQKLTSKACSSLENQKEEMPNTKDIKKECQKAIVGHLLKNKTINKQEIRRINEMNQNRKRNIKTILDSGKPKQTTTLGGQIKNWKNHSNPNSRPRPI